MWTAASGRSPVGFAQTKKIRNHVDAKINRINEVLTCKSMPAAKYTRKDLIKARQNLLSAQNTLNKLDTDFIKKVK